MKKDREKYLSHIKHTPKSSKESKETTGEINKIIVVQKRIEQERRMCEMMRSVMYRNYVSCFSSPLELDLLFCACFFWKLISFILKICIHATFFFQWRAVGERMYVDIRKYCIYFSRLIKEMWKCNRKTISKDIL